MVLSGVLKELGYSIILCHCDHGIRKESGEDAKRAKVFARPSAMYWNHMKVFLDYDGDTYVGDLESTKFNTHFTENLAEVRTESDIGDELDALIKEAKKKHEGDYAEVERANRRIAAAEEALSSMEFKGEVKIFVDRGIFSGIQYLAVNKRIYLVHKETGNFTAVKECSASNRLFVSSKLEELMKEAIKHIK
jgi:hypothetical protein